MNSIDLSRVLIAGGGKFGTQIMNYFLKEGYTPVLVDPTIHTNNALSFERVVDKKGFLSDMEDILGRTTRPIQVLCNIEDLFPDIYFLDFGCAYLAPAAPVNVIGKITRKSDPAGYKFKVSTRHLYEVATCLKCKDDYDVDVNDENGICIASYAPPGKICPKKCPGNLDYCSHRGPTTREPLHKLLNKCLIESASGSVNLVFESKQLDRGVGAIEWNDVLEIRKRINHSTIHEGMMVFSGSACNCHGVINGFELVKW
ncbi:MAG: hypothetical protein ACTSUE_03280 [Promethearchaeota archaeon]